MSVSQELIDLLRQAVSTAQGDQRSAATQMLQQVTQQAPELVEAWSWLAYSTDDPLERVGSMQRVVALDPDDEGARNWLERNGFPVKAPARDEGQDAAIDGLWGAETAHDLGGESELTEAAPDLDDVDFTPLPRSPSSPDFGELMQDLETAGEVAQSNASTNGPLANRLEANASAPFPGAEQQGVGLGALSGNVAPAPASPLELLEDAMPPTQASAESPAAPAKPETGRRPRVLLLHSEASTRNLLRNAFDQLGCRVNVVRDQGEALQVATTKPPDLIFASGEFEGGNAFDLCRTLKALPETAGVVLTAHQPGAGMLVKLKAKTSGVDDFLTGELTSDVVIDLFQRRLGSS